MDEKDINIEHPIGSNDGPRSKLNAYNWLSDIPGDKNDFDMVEVQFKNTRRGFYKNSMNLPLQVGDIVAVEANPGHDIGRVSMIGKLVKLQMKKANLRADAEIRRVFRKAKASDLEKFEAAKAREYDTMIRSRRIAKDLNLNMKIGDVEYQGDGNKAIFYYIADERVDFRQLIKVLAEAFRVRIEMKQIGARQEAGRIGGIGPCGRPLCCSSWMSNFVSVATSAARFQDISLNPQKLAGQCAKLKCCLNYEVDAYVEAVKKLPSKEIRLETKDNTYVQFKTDIFGKLITYSTDKNVPANLVTITASRAFEVIALNKRGIKPDSLLADGEEVEKKKSEFGDIVGQDSVTRFDKAKKKKRKKPNGSPNASGGQRSQDKPHQEGEPRQQEPRQQRNNNRKGEGGEQRNRRQPRRNPDNRNGGERGKANNTKPQQSNGGNNVPKTESGN
ncbi:MAG: regulatory iron-sulfur-containing complex subunit RicT [Candidatus Limisoma sp.]|nr:regulatory iron-sulfur-containing complex subunit RicT [Candidatus Limisoma sp.]